MVSTMVSMVVSMVAVVTMMSMIILRAVVVASQKRTVDAVHACRALATTCTTCSEEEIVRLQRRIMICNEMTSVRGTQTCGET